MKIQKLTRNILLRYVAACLLSIILILSLIVMAGCSSKETTTTTVALPSNYTTYTDDAGLFSISYPQEWETGLSYLPDADAAISDIIKSINSDIPVEKVSTIFLAGLVTDTSYIPNVIIGVEPLSGLIITHDTMVEAEIRGIKSVVQDYHQISQVKTNIYGRTATVLEWEGSYPDLGTSHVLQLFILVGKTAWVVSCTPPPGEYDQWNNDFQIIVRSLNILK